MRYAGMSPNINSIGVYGYDAQHDKDELTAKQISHMLWYVLDGRSRGKREAALDEKIPSTNTIWLLQKWIPYSYKAKDRKVVDAIAR